MKSRLRLLSFTLLLGLTVFPGTFIAGPASPLPGKPVLPDVGKTVFFKRHYSKQHLADNPGQKVEQIVIELTNLSAEAGYRIYLRALMKGEKRPVYSVRGYLNEPESAPDSFRFQLDRESGRFTLVFEEDHISLRLLDGDFLTLSTIDENYGQSGDDELLISFSATDEDHRVFKLLIAADNEIDF